MEKRFGRKLEAHVVVEPELIGGVRVVVGDEVLDTSIRARLEQMKAALLRLSGEPRHRLDTDSRVSTSLPAACRPGARHATESR